MVTLSDWPEIVTAVATGSLATLTLAGVVLALRQLGQLSSVGQAELLRWMYQELDRLRSQRRQLFNAYFIGDLSLDHLPNLKEKLMRAADDVAASMDYLGQLVKEKLVRPNLALDMTAEVVVNTHLVLQDYLDMRRSQRGKGYWRHFMDLYKLAKKYLEKHGITVSLFNPALGPDDVKDCSDGDTLKTGCRTERNQDARS